MSLLQKFKKVDWTIVFILFLFMIVGTALIHSATMDHPGYRDLNYPVKNVVYFGLGFVCFFLVSIFNYRLLLKHYLYVYIFGILLLIGLFTPLGAIHGGARGWYDLPGMTFQPAELMKIILILALAAFLARREGETLRLTGDVIPAGLITFLPFALIMLQPDLGNAVILIVIMLGMYWIGNIRLSQVLIGTSVVVGFVALFIFVYSNYHEPMEKAMTAVGGAHWMDRFDAFLDPQNADPEKKRQVEQSKMAIGSGYLTGEGYMKGPAVHANLIYVAYSDTIFVVVAEEFGFVGSAALLMLYFILIYRMILIAMENEDLAGGYLIVGIVSMYVFQIFQNVGMLMGLLPLTGITLPFISYGGTSLLINMLALGLVMSARIHSDKPLEE